MARLPEIRRRGNISQVAPHVPKAGAGWAAIADVAMTGAKAFEGAALEDAAARGAKSVYRDETGKLQVGQLSAFGGPLSDAYNSAAHAKYLAQRGIDISQSMTELAVKYQYDPAGFKEATDLYVQSLRSEEGVPAVLRESVVAGAEKEAASRFNGLYRQGVERDQREADRATKTQRDMLADDYISLYMAGDEEGAAEKYAELENLSSFRKEAAYISETPEETEAYLRGVRGAAKAASLARNLEDLSGASELSDERRAEIEAVLKDPDLDPAARQRLYAATKGRLKTIDANAIAAKAGASDYESKVIHIESGGNPNAQAGTSSAKGLHQFTAGTWRQMVSEMKPAWAKGLSERQLQALRADPAKSREVFAHFRSRNASVLRGAGIPINDQTEYMAHFFGAGGAIKVLTAPSGTLVSDILPAAVKANGFLTGKTVEWAQNWAARKMTVKTSDLAMRQAEFSAIEDQELRSLAITSFRRVYQARADIESATAADYAARMSAEDDTLTEIEVRTDHDLSDQDQASIIDKMREVRGITDRVQETMTALLDPGHVFDRYDGTERNRVDDVAKLELGAENPMSETGMATGAKYLERVGYLPRAWPNAARSALATGDAKQISNAMEFINQALQREPGIAP